MTFPHAGPFEYPVSWPEPLVRKDYDRLIVEQPTIVVRDPVPVMFRRVPDEVTEIGKGISEVEDAIGSLRGRKCYGAFEGGEYRACIQLREGDDPAEIGLEVGELPGGRYARVRLKSEPPDLYDLIGPTFERLAHRPDRDPTRPGIEFYKRHDVIDLLLPIV